MSSASNSSNSSSNSATSASSAPVIVWFKNTDLRLHDHAPFAFAQGIVQEAKQAHEHSVYSEQSVQSGRATNQAAQVNQPIDPKHISSVAPVFIFDSRWFSSITLRNIISGFSWHRDNSIISQPLPDTDITLSTAPDDLNATISRYSPLRARFLIQSVTALKKRLEESGSNLIIRIGKPEQILPTLAQQMNAQAVYTFEEFANEEINIQNKVKTNLSKQKCKLVTWWGGSMYDIADLPCSLSYLPDVYTQFRRKVEGVLRVRQIEAVSYWPKAGKVLKKSIPSNIEVGNVPTLAQLGYPSIVPEEVAHHPASSFPFKGGEVEALKHLQYYFWEKHLIEKYKDTRNGLNGVDYSSKFAPWLALGCISPRYIFHQLQMYEKQVKQNESTYWLYFELLWRDYFRFYGFKHQRRCFFIEGPSQGQFVNKHERTWNYDVKLLKAWLFGRTGYPWHDGFMRELLHSGFMSNRGRQNVASFLVHDLKLDWRLGGAWFESQLIDFDVYSNWGNWCYVAGVGHDPRESRYFSLHRQSKMYDPHLLHAKAWIPQLQTKLFPLAFSTQQFTTYVAESKQYPSKPICGLKSDGFPNGGIEDEYKPRQFTSKGNGRHTDPRSKRDPEPRSDSRDIKRMMHTLAAGSDPQALEESKQIESLRLQEDNVSNSQEHIRPNNNNNHNSNSSSPAPRAGQSLGAALKAKSRANTIRNVNGSESNESKHSSVENAGRAGKLLPNGQPTIVQMLQGQWANKN